MLAFIYIRKIRVGCISEKNPIKFLTLYRNEKNRMFFQPVKIRGKMEKKVYIRYSIKIAAIENKLVDKSSDIQSVNDYEEKIPYMPRFFF